MGDQDVSCSFKYQTTELRRHAKIGGYVYTELTNVEWEHNGSVNYDRSRKEFGYDFFVPGMSVADMNGADFVGFDAPPYQRVAPGADFMAPVFISHFGSPLNATRVRWRVTLLDRFGQLSERDEGEWNPEVRRFSVTTFDSGPIPLPGETGLATVALELSDETGRVWARNYVNLELRESALPDGLGEPLTRSLLSGQALALSRGERGPVGLESKVRREISDRSPRVERTENGWVLRFAPGDVVRTSRSQPAIEPSGAKFAALSAGWVEYDVAVPAEVDLTSARAGAKKVDLSQQLRGRQYPQTEDKKAPSDLTVSLNGVEIGTTRLPDDPADARGTLSHFRGYDPGSYGFSSNRTWKARRSTAFARRSLRVSHPGFGLRSGQMRLNVVVSPFSARRSVATRSSR
jgi:hypothetical protein